MLIFHVHEEDPSNKRHPVRSSSPVESPAVTKSQMTKSSSPSSFVATSLLLSRISCKHASELKKECDASKVFCSCKYVFETYIGLQEIGGALKSKYEQNLIKKRNLFFFNFNSVPRWKCIWGAADENQSKSVGRRDLVQARKNFRQLRFIL